MRSHHLTWDTSNTWDRAPSRQQRVDRVGELLKQRIDTIVKFFRGPMAGDSVTQTLEHPVEGKFRVTIEFIGSSDE